MKKTAILFTMAFVALMAAAQANVAFEYGNFKFKFDSEGKIVSCTGMTTAGLALHQDTIHVPAFAKYSDTWYFVNVLDDNAISNNAYVKVVVVPPGITTIKSAFVSCSNLETVTLPGGVKTIYNNAFRSCPNLTKLTVKTVTPPTVQTITSGVTLPNVTLRVSSSPGVLAKYKANSGWSGLGFKKMSAVDMGDFILNDGSWYIVTGNQRTGQRDYNGWRDMAVMVVRNPYPTTLSETINLASEDVDTYLWHVRPNVVADSAYYGYTQIKQVKVWGEKIGKAAFANCTNIVQVEVGCDTIENKAFEGCSRLTTINFGYSERVKRIGSRAFAGTNITEFTIPPSITSRYNFVVDACDDCRFFTEFKLNGANLYFSVANGLLFDRDGNDLIRVPVGRDPAQWFNKDMPVTFTRISTGACAHNVCSDNVATNALVEIPPTVTTISNYAFEGSKIGALILPSSVTSIGTNIFYNAKLNYLSTGHSNPPALSSDIFNGCTGMYGLSVPVGSTNKYATANYWKKFKEFESDGRDLKTKVGYLNGGNFIVTKAASTSEPGEVKMVYTKNSTSSYVTTIPYEITDNKNGLTYRVTALSDSVFAGNTDVTELVIPSACKTLPRWAFENCSKLKKVTYANGFEPTTMGYRAFWGTAIEEFNVPESATVIQREAFDNCPNLKKLVIETSQTTRVYTNAYGVTNPNANLKVYVSWLKTQNWVDSVANWSSTPSKYLNQWVVLNPDYDGYQTFSSLLPAQLPSGLTAYYPTPSAGTPYYKISGDEAELLLKKNSLGTVPGNYQKGFLLSGTPNKRYLLNTVSESSYDNSNLLEGAATRVVFTGDETDAAYYGWYAGDSKPTRFYRNLNVRRGLAYLKLPYSTFNSVYYVDLVDSFDAGVKGDLNGDGNVNVGDVSALYKAILAGSTDSKYDINDDGNVNVGDVSALYKLILGQ